MLKLKFKYYTQANYHCSHPSVLRITSQICTNWPRIIIAIVKQVVAGSKMYMYIFAYGFHFASWTHINISVDCFRVLDGVISVEVVWMIKFLPFYSK